MSSDGVVPCFWLKIHLSAICHLICVVLDYLAASVVEERSGCSAPGQRKAELLVLQMLHSSPFSEHRSPESVFNTNDEYWPDITGKLIPSRVFIHLFKHLI